MLVKTSAMQSIGPNLSDRIVMKSSPALSPEPAARCQMKLLSALVMKMQMKIKIDPGEQIWLTLPKSVRNATFTPSKFCRPLCLLER